MKMFCNILLFLIFFSCSNTKTKEEQVSDEASPNKEVIDDSIKTEKEIDQVDTMSISGAESVTYEENDQDPDLDNTEELTFIDFITKFKNRVDVSSYANEDYYYSFMKRDYGSPVRLDHLVDAENLQVFRAKYGESEVEADNIWVYDRMGTELSMCYLPSSQIGVEVKKLVIDTISLDPIKLLIDTYYIEYEVTEDFGAPERGAVKKEVESKFEITINDKGECKKVTK